MRKIAAALALLAFGVAAGFVIGARVGPWQFVLADAEYNASILATQIAWAKAGKIDLLVTGPDLSRPENWNPGVDMNSASVRYVIENHRVEEPYIKKVLTHYAPEKVR